MNLRKIFPTIFAAIAIAFSVFLSFGATLAVNNGLKHSKGVALPMATQLLITLCRYHVLTILGLLAIIGIVLTETHIQNEPMKRNSQVILMGTLLILLSGWFFAMSLPGICMCDEWLQW